jgi:hypothetical protein
VAFFQATASAEDYFQRSDELHELSVQQEEEVVPDLVEQCDSSCQWRHWFDFDTDMVGQICDIWFFWCLLVLRTRAPSKGKAWLCRYSNKHGFVERQCVANGILGIWSFQAAQKQFSLSWVLAKSNEIQHTSVPKLFMSFSKFVAVFSLFFTDSRKSHRLCTFWIFEEPVLPLF